MGVVNEKVGVVSKSSHASYYMNPPSQNPRSTTGEEVGGRSIGQFLHNNLITHSVYTKTPPTRVTTSGQMAHDETYGSES